MNCLSSATTGNPGNIRTQEMGLKLAQAWVCGSRFIASNPESGSKLSVHLGCHNTFQYTWEKWRAERIQGKNSLSKWEKYPTIKWKWQNSLEMLLIECLNYSKANTWKNATKSLQSCPTLCDPIDGSPPGSPVPGILQARTLEWAAISSSNVEE